MNDLSVTELGLDPECTATVHPDHVAALAAALDRPTPAPGEPLPLCWHWAFFNPSVPTSQLGPDGHPALDPAGPTGAFSRRMWASGQVTMLAPVLVGTSLTRRSSVVDARRTTGRSGELLLVTIEHRLFAEADVAIVDRQSLVYRQPGEPIAMPVGDHVAPAPEHGWAEYRCCGPVELFRFSAVTFNAHRIHYDRTYASEVEGYPAPVVQGPLTALALAHSSADHLGRSLRSIDFRASAPLFAGLPHTIVGQPTHDGAELQAIRNDRAVAMTARVT